MDHRLLSLYENELTHVRTSAREFADAHPKIAARLGLRGMTCDDPYVERLLEGFAYLAARVQLKLEAEFPRFTQNLLGVVYPHYLAPTPAATIVHLDAKPDAAELAPGFPIPRGSILRSATRSAGGTPCEFRTAHDVRLYPITVVAAAYHTRDVGALGLDLPQGTRAALRIRLRAGGGLTFDKIAADSLVFYLNGSDAVTRRLYETLFTAATQVVVRAAADPGKRSPALQQRRLGVEVIRPVGFRETESLLPYDARSFQGYRLVHEYFACPQRFMFVEFGGLAPALAACPVPEIEIVVPFDRADERLEGGLVRPDLLVLGCTPAINLFPRRAAPIFLTDRQPEHRVVVDPQASHDHEIFAVTGVTGYGDRSDDDRKFRPFYAATDAGGDSGYYAIHRVPRVLTDAERERDPAAALYPGSETYISLVDAAAAPYRDDIRQIGIEALCTNRHLPLEIRDGDLRLVEGGPLRAVRCLVSPTRPRAPHAEGAAAWRAVSHLSLNYLSLAGTEGGSGAAGLRDLLRLYAATVGTDAAVHAKQIAGVRSITTVPIVAPVPSPGPITFARGLEVSLTLDPAAFEDAGTFLFGCVLEEFFARYVTTNSFTRTVLKTPDGKEIKRWESRLGHRPTL